MQEETWVGTPFEELPEPFIEELLDECEPIGNSLYEELSLLKKDENKLRLSFSVTLLLFTVLDCENSESELLKINRLLDD